ELQLQRVVRVVFSSIMALAANRASMTFQHASSLDLLIAAPALIEVLKGPFFRHGIVSVHSHLARFSRELLSVAIGPASAPKPVVNHLVSEGVSDVVRGIVDLPEVTRDLDDRSLDRKERQTNIAWRDETPG